MKISTCPIYGCPKSRSKTKEEKTKAVVLGIPRKDKILLLFG